MKVRVQLRYGQNKPIMALGQSDRHHVTGDLSQHISALEKLRDKFGKFTDKYVTRNIFFFGFIICILFQIN